MSEDLKVFAEDVIDFLNGIEASCVKLRMQIKKLLGSQVKAIIPESAFDALKWQDEKGSRLGDYQVAYKNHNLPEKWSHAFGVLKTNVSLIGDPFRDEGYAYRYWIYPHKYSDRIFRKKLTEAKG